MPSLIYIARIRSLSGQLAQSLRSAGCHVQSFKSGDITQDECLLAMTPEAADTVLHPERFAMEAGRRYAGVAVPDMSQLGADSAVLNCVRAAVANEIQVNREPVHPAASTIESKGAEFPVRAEAAPHAVSSSQERANQPIARIVPPPITAPSSSEIPREAKNSRLALERCYRILRNPLSTVVAVLVLAVLYRGLPAITASSGHTAVRLTSGSAASAEASRQPVQRAQRHVSLDGFVAEDFTNHPRLHASGDAAQNVDLKHPQRSSVPKRIVVD